MKSFRDPITNVLKAFGYCDTNAPGDLVRDEPDGFNIDPGKYACIDGVWALIVPTEAELQAQASAAIQSQIDTIERETGVPRVTREMMLTYAEDLATRTAAEMTANGEPTTADQLLMENIAYVRTKAVDDQIRALRELL